MRVGWRSRRGFTLVELVVVIVVLAALAALAVPVYDRVKGSARDHTAMAELSALAREAWAVARADGKTVYDGASFGEALEDLNAGGSPAAAGDGSVSAAGPAEAFVFMGAGFASTRRGEISLAFSAARDEARLAMVSRPGRCVFVDAAGGTRSRAEAADITDTRPCLAAGDQDDLPAGAKPPTEPYDPADEWAPGTEPVCDGGACVHETIDEHNDELEERLDTPAVVGDPALPGPAGLGGITSMFSTTPGYSHRILVTDTDAGHIIMVRQTGPAIGDVTVTTWATGLDGPKALIHGPTPTVAGRAGTLVQYPIYVGVASSGGAVVRIDPISRAVTPVATGLGAAPTALWWGACWDPGSPTRRPGGCLYAGVGDTIWRTTLTTAPHTSVFATLPPGFAVDGIGAAGGANPALIVAGATQTVTLPVAAAAGTTVTAGTPIAGAAGGGGLAWVGNNTSPAGRRGNYLADGDSLDQLTGSADHPLPDARDVTYHGQPNWLHAATTNAVYVVELDTGTATRLWGGPPPPTLADAGALAVSTLAGTGTAGYADGQLASPQAVAVVGNTAYVSTPGQIRKVDLTTGAVSFFSGSVTGERGYQDGPAAGARYDTVASLTSDGASLYATDYNLLATPSRTFIRKIDLATGAASTLVQSSGGAWWSPAVFTSVVAPGDGNLYFAAQRGGSATYGGAYGGVYKRDPAGNLTQLPTPTGCDSRNIGKMTGDGAGNLYVRCDWKLFKVPTDGSAAANIGADDGDSWDGLAHADGRLFILSGSNTIISGKAADGTGSPVLLAGTQAASFADGVGYEAWFNGAQDVVAAAGKLYIADTANNRLRVAVPAHDMPAGSSPVPSDTTVSVAPGAVTSPVGSGTAASVDGTGTAAAFNGSGQVAVAGGHAYVFEPGKIRLVDLATGVVSTWLGTGSPASTDSADPTAVRVNYPDGIAADSRFLYLVEHNAAATEWRLRRVSRATKATVTLATYKSSYSKRAYDVAAAAGYVWVSGRDTNYVDSSRLWRVDPITGAETSWAWHRSAPAGLAADADFVWWVDQSGYLYKIPTATVKGLASSVAYLGASHRITSAGDFLYATGGRTVYRFAKANFAAAHVAGAGPSGFADGVGIDAWFTGIGDIASDGSALWVTDANRLRTIVAGVLPPSGQLAPSTQTLTIGAGAGNVTTVAPVDAAGSPVTLTGAAGVVVTGGTAYVAGRGGIWTIDTTTGLTRVLSGAPGTAATPADAQNPSAARFAQLGEMTSDGRYLYVVDTVAADNARIRRVSMTTGSAATVAVYNSSGNWSSLTGITFGPDGYLYVTGYNSGYRSAVLQRLDPITGATFSAAQGNATPRGAAADGSAVYWIDGWGDLRRTVADGTVNVTKLFGVGSVGKIASAGDYLYAISGSTVVRYAKAGGGPVTVAGGGPAGADGTGGAAGFAALAGITSDGTSVWVTDGTTLRRISG